MDQPHSLDNKQWMFVFGAWLVATLSTLGSLFFSEVMELVPCVLCWYQRIFIFPLPVILLIGLLLKDRNVVSYALPIVVIGLLFTIYHILLFYGVIPESLQPCTKGVSCSDDSMILFGFLPIPLLSLAAFSTMIFLLLKARNTP